MYKVQAVILSIQRIRDNQTRVVMISREYGKITGWWNKKNITGIDIWDLIEVLISRQESKNLIKNIDIQIPGWSKSWNYGRIISFLDTLHMVNKMSIEWSECYTLYEDIAKFITYGKSQDINIGHHTVFQMRILKSLGSMDQGMLGTDPILRYIYDHISDTPLDRILSSSTLKTEHIAKIQQINLHSLYMLER